MFHSRTYIQAARPNFMYYVTHKQSKVFFLCSHTVYVECMLYVYTALYNWMLCYLYVYTVKFLFT